MGINPSEELAYAEFQIELKTGEVTELESVMDEINADSDGSAIALDQVADIRADINNVRAAIGFWRGEASFWRQEINENKLANKEGNKLSGSS